MRARGVAVRISRIGSVRRKAGICYLTVPLLIRRARGALLRLARRRALAIVVGLTLAGPAAWLEVSGGAAGWWVEGLSLILVATGAALVWMGMAGRTPDWTDPER